MFEKLTKKAVRVRSSRQEMCNHIPGGICELSINYFECYSYWDTSKECTYIKRTVQFHEVTLCSLALLDICYP